jgi:DeoR family transcriptional regulator, aga operon transcriptional repressor
MSGDALPGALRRDRIAALVEDRGFVRVAELSRIFRTSPVTIRTDLDELVSRDLVRRVHGGAVPTSRAPQVPSGDEDPLIAERARIAAAGAARVASGETIVLAGAPSTRMMARALRDRADLQEVIAVTNDLHIALELQPTIPRFTVIVTGGTLRADAPSVGDPLGGMLLADVTAAWSVVGCAGISAARGVTEAKLGSVEDVRRLFRAGTRRLVLAEAERVGAVRPGRVAPSEDVDLLITAAGADDGELARLRERGVDVEIVD